MGRLGLVGDASGKRYSIKEGASGEVQVVNETDGVTLLKVNPTTVVDAGGVALNAHASRHAYGGADALPDNSLRLRQVKVEFAADTSVTVTAGGTYTVPEGVWYVRLGANTRVELYIAGAWNVLIPAGGIGLVMSDGANVRLYNAGTASESSTLKEVR
ncbi:MAG: hypothetical protein QXJ59_01840 [Thermofilaceae archaeon]